MIKIIKTKNLETDFLKYKDVIIDENKTTFIVGVSGAGKSTLLKIFNGTEKFKGEVTYKETYIKDENYIKLRRKIMLIGQQCFLYDLTIIENFKKIYELRDEKMISEDKVNKYLKMTCIEGSLNRKCQDLSGGERQRVFIALMLSFKSEVLMIDEPTSALDNETALKVVGNIKKNCKEEGITLIVVSHDEELVNKYADEIVRL